jgi:hypothetical protein
MIVDKVEHTPGTISRRAVIRAAVVAGVLISTADQLAAAVGPDISPLDPNDPAAKALGFTNDTTKVDAGANPTHISTQKCGTCVQFQGKPGDTVGGCNIFPGHSVPQGGWCKVWARAPGA